MAASPSGAAELDAALAAFSELAADTRRYAAGVRDVAGAEARLAAGSLVAILIGAVVAATLIIAAWVSLGMALATIATAAGASWAVALAGVALFNVLGAYGAWRAVRSLAENLRFAITRRFLNDLVHRDGRVDPPEG